MMEFNKSLMHISFSIYLLLLVWIIVFKWTNYVATQVLVLDYNFTSTGIQAFNDMMTIKEFSQEFTTNLVMTVLYTAIGIAYEIYRLSKSIRRPGTIK